MGKEQFIFFIVFSFPFFLPFQVRSTNQNIGLESCAAVFQKPRTVRISLLSLQSALRSGAFTSCPWGERSLSKATYSCHGWVPAVTRDLPQPGALSYYFHRLAGEYPLQSSCLLSSLFQWLNIMWKILSTDKHVIRLSTCAVDFFFNYYLQSLALCSPKEQSLKSTRKISWWSCDS